MSRAHARLTDLVIPISTQISNAVVVADIEDAVALVITAPATLDAFVFTIQVRRWAGATFAALQEGDIGAALANVVVPLADKALTYEMSRIGISAFHSFRIKSDTNVAAERTFELAKIWEGI